MKWLSKLGTSAIAFVFVISLVACGNGSSKVEVNPDNGDYAAPPVAEEYPDVVGEQGPEPAGQGVSGEFELTDRDGYRYHFNYTIGALNCSIDTTEGKPGEVVIIEPVPESHLLAVNITSGKKAPPPPMGFLAYPIYEEYALVEFGFGYYADITEGNPEIQYRLQEVVLDGKRYSYLPPAAGTSPALTFILVDYQKELEVDEVRGYSDTDAAEITHPSAGKVFVSEESSEGLVQALSNPTGWIIVCSEIVSTGSKFDSAYSIGTFNGGVGGVVHVSWLN